MIVNYSKIFDSNRKIGLLLLSVIIFTGCSDSTSSNSKYWIEFEIGNQSYRYEKGFTPETIIDDQIQSDDAYLMYIPQSDEQDEQYLVGAFENTIKSTTQRESGIAIGFWHDGNGTQWKWAIAFINKSEGGSETENMNIPGTLIDTNVKKGEILRGSIAGEYQFVTGPDSARFIKNISYSVMRIN